jgi:amino-acid N-acetyltransferase
MRIVVDNGPGRRRRRTSGPALGPASTPVLRAGVAADAPALHALITANAEEGHLLPRALGELTVHAPRFVVAVRPTATGEEIVGCAELAPLSPEVAEVRSLAVARDARRLGLGRRMVEELTRRTRVEGYSRLCAFAHDPAFFVRMGFSIVPHTWLPEKIGHDCWSCPLFRRCGQYAVVRELDPLNAGIGDVSPSRPSAAEAGALVGPAASASAVQPGA